jgi:hypothetical protein
MLDLAIAGLIKGRNSGAAPLPKGSSPHAVTSLRLEPEKEIGFGLIRFKPTNPSQTECGVRGFFIDQPGHSGFHYIFIKINGLDSYSSSQISQRGLRPR